MKTRNFAPMRNPVI